MRLEVARHGSKDAAGSHQGELEVKDQAIAMDFPLGWDLGGSLECQPGHGPLP